MAWQHGHLVVEHLVGQCLKLAQEGKNMQKLIVGNREEERSRWLPVWRIAKYILTLQYIFVYLHFNLIIVALGKWFN